MYLVDNFLLWGYVWTATVNKTKATLSIKYPTMTIFTTVSELCPTLAKHFGSANGYLLSTHMYHLHVKQSRLSKTLFIVAFTHNYLTAAAHWLAPLCFCSWIFIVWIGCPPSLPLCRCVIPVMLYYCTILQICSQIPHSSITKPINLSELFLP